MLFCKQFRVQKERSKCQSSSIHRRLWEHRGKAIIALKTGVGSGSEKEWKVGTRKVLAEMISNLGSEGYITPINMW